MILLLGTITDLGYGWPGVGSLARLSVPGGMGGVFQCEGLILRVREEGEG